MVRVLSSSGGVLGASLHPNRSEDSAERFADGDIRGFDPALRVHAVMRQIKWLVLDCMMKAGTAFHRESLRHSGKPANGLVHG